jgi:hypothetical protein
VLAALQVSLRNAQVATGLRDRFAGSDSSANPLALEPSFELAFSKPTLLGIAYSAARLGSLESVFRPIVTVLL